MPFFDIGLHYDTSTGILIVSEAKQSEIIYNPLQLFIKYYEHPKTKEAIQKIYLQQVITKFTGGYFTPMKGFSYQINVKKATGVQRSLVNFETINEDINKLTVEANRFMYMYCRTDII
jgi:type VI protein secretion system component VasA